MYIKLVNYIVVITQAAVIVISKETEYVAQVMILQQFLEARIGSQVIQVCDEARPFAV